ncbi:hypothetical protein [Maritalea sp.]|jgi:hypothetical protein|uniref:hypothetical protein n=1 Tax=Maritalea sp. TaxID=2003361 RepID=UPI0039E3785E
MSASKKELQFNFLQDNCGPTIRHLLSRYPGEVQKDDLKENYDVLLQMPEVLYWKGLIPTEATGVTVLGSRDACFENSFGMLLQFGLSVNDILSQDLLQVYIDFLATNTGDGIYESLARYVVAGYLFAAGCSVELVNKTVLSRIDVLFELVTTSPFKHDIYVDATDHAVPSAYKSRKLVNPILYQRGELELPLVHDVFIFSKIYDRVSGDYKKKIDAIVAHIADEKYQSLDYGYGIIKTKENKFHAMGWSAHMPLFNEQLSSEYFKKGLIFRMALFSRFDNAGIRKWIENILATFEEYQVDDCRYCFSSTLLPETKNSYFLNGRHTSLNENRRKKSGRIVESTYYAFLANQCLD